MCFPHNFRFTSPVIASKPTFPTRSSFRLSNQPRSDQSSAYTSLLCTEFCTRSAMSAYLSIKEKNKRNSIIIISHSLTGRESKCTKGNSQLNASIYVKNHHVHKTQLFIKLINRFFCFLFLFALSRARSGI